MGGRGLQLTQAAGGYETQRATFAVAPLLRNDSSEGEFAERI